MALTKLERRLRIKKRIRKNIFGTSARPRLSVFRSNKEITAQLIDDENAVTMVAVSSRSIKSKGTKSEIAKEVGTALAGKATKAGIEVCSFDRNGYLYHGRIKSLAEGAREGGLKF